MHGYYSLPKFLVAKGVVQYIQTTVLQLGWIALVDLIHAYGQMDLCREYQYMSSVYINAWTKTSTTYIMGFPLFYLLQLHSIVENSSGNRLEKSSLQDSI